MFRKAFTVKSNTNMRNSDRKKLLLRISNAHAIPPKAQAAQVNLVAANGLRVNVYTFDKNPLLFEVEGDPNVYPTVYFTWMSPKSYSSLMVPEQVMSFLENGADLMLPGVVRQPGSFPEFGRYTPVVIYAITKNGFLKGPLAVGFSLLSSMEMIACGMQGRGVQILHLYRDQLWEFGNRQHPPEISTTTITVQKALTEDDFPPLGDVLVSVDPECYSGEADDGVVDEQEECQGVANANEQNEVTTSDTSSTPLEDSMEDLLLRCFLAALKYRVTKKGTLPLDVGEFYARCLLASVPPTRRIDMKKTVYKKFTVFLNSVNSGADGPIVKLAAKSKGAEMITEIVWDHPFLTNFKLKDEVTEDKPSAAKQCVTVREFYAITEPVLPLFRITSGASKGDLLDASEARDRITSFVKSQNLNDGKKVSLRDEILRSVVKHSEETIDWNSLMQKVLSRMTKTFIIETADGRKITRKLELPKITFKIETRPGSKKVTLINNLAVFGIEAKPLCHQIQLGVAASAAVVNDAPQCEGPQVVVQGNQIQFVSELLSSEFGVDRKYMVGLELIPKKKK